MVRPTPALLVVITILAGCAEPTPDDTRGDECLPAHGPDMSIVYGIVTDDSGAPLSAATVKASALTHRHEISDDTDAMGCYWIELQAGAPHDMEASKPGYGTDEAQSVTLDPREERKVNFELARLA